jgi:hypothetical protein
VVLLPVAQGSLVGPREGTVLQARGASGIQDARTPGLAHALVVVLEIPRLVALSARAARAPVATHEHLAAHRVSEQAEGGNKKGADDEERKDDEDGERVLAGEAALKVQAQALRAVGPRDGVSADHVGDGAEGDGDDGDGEALPRGGGLRGVQHYWIAVHPHGYTEVEGERPAACKIKMEGKADTQR